MVAIPAEEIAEWSPPILVSDRVSDSRHLGQFIERCRAGFVAPPIHFSAPRALAIAGLRFAVVDRDVGLVVDSIHTLGRHDWHALFFGVNGVRLHPEKLPPPLLVGNSGSENYYHWTLEAAGAMLVQQVYDEQCRAFVMPSATARWQREILEFLSIDAELIEVAANELMVFDAAVTTNLTGREYSFAPHPVVLAELRSRAALRLCNSDTRRIYIARSDAQDRRPMTNEADVCDLVRSYGFDVVIPGQLPVAEQASLFRNAEMIIAPHGAGLTNLVYAGDGQEGPELIELMHDAYLARGYVKIAQAKRLPYRALINPGTRVDYHHDASWTCDLNLLESLLQQS